MEVSPDASTEYVVEPGTFIKGDLILCSTASDDEVLGKVMFSEGIPDDPGLNPDWYAHDKLDLPYDSQRRVTTWFQTVPGEPGMRMTLRPVIHWKTSEGDKYQYDNPLNDIHFVVDSLTQSNEGTPPPHTPGPHDRPNCANPGVPPPPAPILHVEIANMHQTGAQTDDEDNGDDVQNYSTVGPGAFLVGSVKACAVGTVGARTVRLGVKFVPVTTDLPEPYPNPPGMIDPFIVAQWEDAPFNRAPLTQDIESSEHNTVFYQKVPRTPGTYLFIPRVIGVDDNGDIGPLPDSRVLAEGDPFVVCVGPPPNNLACQVPQGY